MTEQIRPQIEPLFEEPVHSPAWIVNSLVDVFGKTLGEEILNVIETEDISEVIVLGPPGSGKTTILRGIQRIQEKRMGKSSESFFDDALRKYLHKINKVRTLAGALSARAIRDLTDYELLGFEPYIHKKLTNSVRINTISTLLNTEESENTHQDISLKFKKFKKPIKRIHFMEFPGVGAFDRGRSIVRDVAKKFASGGKKDAIIIQVIAEKEVYELAKRVRALLDKCTNNYELKLALLESGIDHGIPTIADIERSDLLDEFRRMATAQQIEMIWEEYIQQSKDAIAAAEERNNSLIAVTRYAIKVASNLREGSDWQQIGNLVLAAYVRLLQEEKFPEDTLFGLSPRVFVVVNRFAGGVDYSSTI